MLKKYAIWMDSTLYEDGHNSSQTHYDDFRRMPKKTRYRFENDPIVEDPEGCFVEAPISTYRVTPLFFWRFACTKKFASYKHRVFADGIGAGGSSGSLMLRILARPSKSLVFSDGLRTSFL